MTRESATHRRGWTDVLVPVVNAASSAIAHGGGGGGGNTGGFR